MSWDPGQSPRDLTQAADSLDRPRVNELCGKLIVHVRAHDEPYPLTPALAILGVLRRRRHFLLLQRTADAFIQTGLDNPTIRRQYAQALIDRENLTAAVAVLDRLIGKTAGQGREDAEARGLLGRAYKQMFVATGPAAAERRARLLERAIAPYLAVWSEVAGALARHQRGGAAHAVPPGGHPPAQGGLIPRPTRRPSPARSSTRSRASARPRPRGTRATRWRRASPSTNPTRR